MICPCCDVDMLVVEHRGIEIDHCPDCRGSWFDQGEIELLVPGWTPVWQAGAAPGSKPEAGRRCPRCRKDMAKAALGGVTIDRCGGQHGIWFDRGELAAVVEAEFHGDAAVVAFVTDLFGRRREAK